MSFPSGLIGASRRRSEAGSSVLEPVAWVRAKFNTGKSLLSASWTELNPNVEIADNGWGYTPGSSSFVVPAGVNLVEAAFQVYGQTAVSMDSQARITLDGVNKAYCLTDNQNWLPLQQKAILAVTPGQVIKFWVYTQSACTLSDTWTQFAITGYSV